MSDRLKNTNTISNQEVIEDLTKDLEFLSADETTANDINPETTVDDFINSAGDAQKTGKDYVIGE
ncbi:hypothetical protein RR48_01333 [Papilio machaon]|uniref:Uncharacterized protein n=1 Tax=Papilio machaon TaxID=76193 RepID=A0A0N1PJB4_PAPMA|nr:hypothetical protein RR48_01333 [Papilio machaon]